LTAARSALRALSVVLLASLLVACGGKKNHNAQPTSARATPVVTPSPEQLLMRAGDTLNSLKAFHFVLTHQNGSTPIAQGINMTTAEGDFVQPDAFKGTVEGKLQSGFTVQAKVISVGNNVWIALADDTYLPLPNGIGAAAILDPQNGVLKAVRSVKSPQFVGTDHFDNTDMTVVAGTVDAGDLTALDQAAQPGKQVTGRVWIGNQDNRIYRIRLEGPLNDQEPGNIVRQIDLSQFNESITIQPPQ
jgi:hypothetical protein